MTAAASVSAPAAPSRAGHAWRAAWLLGGLAAATLARWLVTDTSSLPRALLAGTGFAIALFGAALLADWRPAWLSPRALAIGIAGGALLVALPILLHPVAGAAIGMRPGPFAAWAAVTILVASAEEVLLRGALFTTVGTRFGVMAAVLVSSAAFALMHVPLYGWSVMPLDLAAGVWLAGMRMAGGGVAAPAVAHVLADLATWWI